MTPRETAYPAGGFGGSEDLGASAASGDLAGSEGLGASEDLAVLAGLAAPLPSMHR